MIGGVLSIAVFVIIALAIWITILKDRLKQTEAELDEVTEERDRAREYNIYWRGHEKLITNYQEMSDHFRTDWEAKVNENAALIAEKDAYDKFRREYVEKCVRYYEDHHRQKDDQDPQPKSDDGSFTSLDGMSQEMKQAIAYDYWRMEGFVSKKDDQSIFIRIGSRLGISASTAEQYVKKYIRNNGHVYERDLKERDNKITTLPMAENS